MVRRFFHVFLWNIVVFKHNSEVPIYAAFDALHFFIFHEIFHEMIFHIPRKFSLESEAHGWLDHTPLRYKYEKSGFHLFNADKVLGPTIPSTTRGFPESSLCSFWKSKTDNFVCLPKTPSMTRFAPCLFSSH